MANWKIIIMYYKELCKYKVHIGIAEMESPSIPIAGLWVDVCIAFAHGLCQPLEHFRPPGSSQVLSKKSRPYHRELLWPSKALSIYKKHFVKIMIW